MFEETFRVAKHTDLFPKCVSMVLPSYQNILIGHSKDRWERIARELGIAVPESYSIDELQPAAIKANGSRYPVFREAQRRGEGRGAFSRSNRSRPCGFCWAQTRITGKPWNRFFVQERIPGETHCVGMLFGQMGAKVAYKELRDYPVTGGQATIERVSMPSGKAEMQTHFSRR